MCGTVLGAGGRVGVQVEMDAPTVAVGATSVLASTILFTIVRATKENPQSTSPFLGKTRLLTDLGNAESQSANTSAHSCDNESRLNLNAYYDSIIKPQTVILRKSSKTTEKAQFQSNPTFPS